MSNLPASRAESAGVLIAPETIGSLGIPPTTGWRTMQPDQDQINNFYRNIKTVAPSPISAERQMQAPVIVDADAQPTLSQDLTGDLLNDVDEGMLLVKAKHSGGTGSSRFVPSARTTSAYTVTAGGALQAGTLVFARGWVNTANNGLFVVGAGSTSTTINVSGGVAETPSGYLATLGVAGFRGASGDIQLDVNGNLISTVADFTTMGLNVGQEIYVGGVPGTAFAFATAGYSGVAEVAAVATNLLTLRRRAWTIAAADTGTGKTIDLYWSRWLRNVATTSADYQEQPYHLELTLSGIGGGGANEYVYAQGQYISTFKITAALAQLVKCELAFLGTDVTDPSTTRVTGPSTAPVPLEVDRFNTASSTGEPYVQIINAATEASVASDIMSWTLNYSNGVTGQKQQGKIGPKRIIVGKVDCSIDMELVVTQDDAIKACTANTTLSFGSLLRNTNGGVFVNVPSLKFTGAVPKFPANGVVTISPKAGAFVDANLRYTLGLSEFDYLPAS